MMKAVAFAELVGGLVNAVYAFAFGIASRNLSIFFVGCFVIVDDIYALYDVPFCET